MDTRSGGLTAVERLFRDTAGKFAQREVVPTAVDRDEQGDAFLDRAK